MNDQDDSPTMTNPVLRANFSKSVRAKSSYPLVFSTLHIEVIIEDGDWTSLGPIEALADETVGALAKYLGNESDKKARSRCYQAALALTSDAHVAKLNETYRGKRGPTNVLSFQNPMAMPETERHATHSPVHPAPVHLGDIVMAWQTMQEEANERAIPPQDHFRHLLVHGLLHLAGYDHETDEQARKMEACEVEIIKTLGVPDPYGGRATS